MSSFPRRAVARGDDGIATVWAVSWMFVCLSLAWLALLAAAVTGRQHHLDGSADLVAVSAAARLERGGDACAVAVSVAEANTVHLVACQVDGADVVVTVTDEMALPFGVDGSLMTTARAGP